MKVVNLFSYDFKESISCHGLFIVVVDPLSVHLFSSVLPPSDALLVESNFSFSLVFKAWSSSFFSSLC